MSLFIAFSTALIHSPFRSEAQLLRQQHVPLVMQPEDRLGGEAVEKLSNRDRPETAVWLVQGYQTGGAEQLLAGECACHDLGTKRHHETIECG